jgi:hypothetical protein
LASKGDGGKPRLLQRRRCGQGAVSLAGGKATQRLAELGSSSGPDERRRLLLDGASLLLDGTSLLLDRFDGVVGTTETIGRQSRPGIAVGPMSRKYT